MLLSKIYKAMQVHADIFRISNKIIKYTELKVLDYTNKQSLLK